MSLKVDNEAKEKTPAFVQPSSSVSFLCIFSDESVQNTIKANDDDKINSSSSNSTANNTPDGAASSDQIELIRKVDNTEVTVAQSSPETSLLHNLTPGTTWSGQYVCRHVVDGEAVESTSLVEVILRDVVVEPLPDAYLNQAVTAEVTVTGDENSMTCGEADVKVTNSAAAKVEYGVSFTASKTNLTCVVAFDADSAQIEAPILLKVIG